MGARIWGLLSLIAIAACGGRTPTKADEPMDAGVDAEPDAGPTEQRESDKLDVLFVVDNSATASFAHPMLARTIPYLLERLFAPPCVNGLGQIVDEPGVGVACERGIRDFARLRDVHIGVITSSLGGYGSDVCNSFADENESAHLLARGEAGAAVPTYQGLGFLAWDPDQRKTPPGEANNVGIEINLASMLLGVGELGCGFEAPLEAMYRFLVAPDPYESITVFDGQTIPQGFDQVVLEQRASFLRPDSAVLVVVISDEDDCSVRPTGEAHLLGSTNQMWGARAECEVDPDDPCCASCAPPTPAGCPPDPTCGFLSADEDPLNLRCFEQKRRFGVDYLHPIDRYVAGLSERQISDREGNVVDNPLFIGSRSPGMVTLSVITGVPWQDISISPQSPAAGFVAATDIPWARLLGDAPEDPLMIPTRAARTGTHPVTGDDLAPTEAGYLANPINGHEHSIPDELQFACIYALETPDDCLDGRCECTTNIENNPVCQNADGTYGIDQTFGRATPATRQLALVRELDTISTLASICTLPVFDAESPGFGYKPAVDGMLRTLRRSLVKEE